jgi:hypothetical protein
MSGACVLSLLVTLGKYGDPLWTAGESYPGPRLFGGARLDAVMPYFPLVLLAFGLAMVSRWRVPRFGRAHARWANIYIVAALLFGYACGLLHTLPEYIALGGAQYILFAVYAHLFATPKDRPEPLFPV